MYSSQSKDRKEGEVDNQLIEIRLITRSEDAQWNQLMSAYHYLGYHGFVGERLKYVATYHDQWIALLGWSAASLKNTHRDLWIGWSKEIQFKRLKYLTNNTRYLILPWIVKKNLASRVLSLNLKRLNQDWQHRYGHPILLVETFVDSARFKGTCYKASGWKELGQTKGFGRSNGRYHHHGIKKRVFVYSLHAQAREVLSAEMLSPLFIRRHHMTRIDMNKIPRKSIQDLRDKLSQIPDDRDPRGVRHPQLFLLTIAVCSVLSGCRSYKAMGEWSSGLTQKMLKELGGKYNGYRGCYVAPEESTLQRMLGRIDVDKLDRVVGTWFESMADNNCIAVDGKRLKGASHAKPVHLMSAFIHEQGLVINQEQIADKTNEIPFFRYY